jgi:hypothetical protein
MKFLSIFWQTERVQQSYENASNHNKRSAFTADMKLQTSILTVEYPCITKQSWFASVNRKSFHSSEREQCFKLCRAPYVWAPPYTVV